MSGASVIEVWTRRERFPRKGVYRTLSASDRSGGRTSAAGVGRRVGCSGPKPDKSGEFCRGTGRKPGPRARVRFTPWLRPRDRLYRRMSSRWRVSRRAAVTGFASRVHAAVVRRISSRRIGRTGGEFDQNGVRQRVGSAPAVRAFRHRAAENLTEIGVSRRGVQKPKLSWPSAHTSSVTRRVASPVSGGRTRRLGSGRYYEGLSGGGGGSMAL